MLRAFLAWPVSLSVKSRHGRRSIVFIFQDDRHSAKGRQGEDLKAAVEMNPDTTKKAKKEKKTPVSIHAV